MELNSVFESDQLASVFQLVRSGFGVTVVPEMAAPFSSGCKLIPLRGNSFRRVGYLRARRHFVSRPMREFADWMRTLVPGSVKRVFKENTVCAS
jgi:DNA-binding transcriptional LysR family regulator